MATSLLLDTDILIDYLYGRHQAVNFLEDLRQPLFISAMTVAELLSRSMEGRDRRVLERYLLAFEVVPIDSEIAQKAGIYRQEYGATHGILLADAIIAATSEVKEAQLVALDADRFPMVTVKVPYVLT